ncbi:MAG TPA: uridine phosphorylase [Planctomycetes bacterium]|nr:uridine phosphorylase [Planctomycetota bacterium]
MTQHQNDNDRQYHIGLGRGDVASKILISGDPERIRRASQRLDKIDGEWTCREFLTITGQWSGQRVSLMATGIGAANIEIAMIELSAIVEDPVIIRAGSCGGIDPAIELGDLVVSWAAVRMENTSTTFVPEGYPAVAHPDVIQALLASATKKDFPVHLGITATAPGFYGAQGREVQGFPARNPQIIEELARIGVSNMEMEASTLFTLASLRGWRAGCVCTVFGRRHHDQFVPHDDKPALEDACVDVALDALVEIPKR